MTFTTLTSKAIPLPEDNIDTDIIYPGRFLLRIDKEGAGECLFYDRRFTTTQEYFPFNDALFDGAKVLVAGENFGCGSSREQAVWALHDYGIRCVIAKSFGEIFFANCINNQILPIQVTDDEYEQLLLAANNSIDMHINLVHKRLSVANILSIEIAIGRSEHDMLINGLDEIGLQLKNDMHDITAFEAKQQKTQHWLWT
jgi:3-isopropylmalate/(R)-2-methylmalate dehydratase small subunit